MTELEIAAMESNMADCEDKYFGCLSSIASKETRKSFQAGFEIAWKKSMREAANKLIEQPVTPKPLFIPLMKEYYRLFESRIKKAELRKYGSKWNEKTCAIGREVILSNGYGKKNRMRGRVVDFKKIPAIGLGTFSKRSVLEVYGTLDIDIAMISIEIY